MMENHDVDESTKPRFQSAFGVQAGILDNKCSQYSPWSFFSLLCNLIFPPLIRFLSHVIATFLLFKKRRDGKIAFPICRKIWKLSTMETHLRSTCCSLKSEKACSESNLIWGFEWKRAEKQSGKFVRQKMNFYEFLIDWSYKILDEPVLLYSGVDSNSCLPI
jgi:hypothetical protein